jgi:hypothetical protein
VSLLLIIMLMSGSTPAAAAPLVSSEDAAPVTLPESFDLTWPQDVRLSIEASPYEIVVQFDQPIDDVSIKRFAEAMGEQLADLRWNDTSLVLRAAEGRAITAATTGRTLRVQFIPDSARLPTEQAAPPSQPDMERQLAVARAQADSAAGYPSRARQRLEVLAATDPADTGVQRLLADAEAADGSLADAAARYRLLKAEDLAASRVIAQAGGGILAGVNYRDYDDFSQTEFNALANVRVSPQLVLGGGIRQFRSWAAGIDAPEGRRTDVTSHDTLGDLLAAVYFGRDTRIEFRATGQFDHDIFGGSIKLVAGPLEKQGRLTLAYHVPELLTPEQAILGGYTTRAAVGGSIRPRAGIYLQGDVGLNGYGLKKSGSSSDTIFVTAGADFLLRRRSPTVSVNYQLDAEYVQRLDLRSNGTAFIPLSDRENHTVQLVSSFSLSKVQFTAAAGWTVDRIDSSNGPTANISANALLGRSWRLEANGGVSSISRPGIPSGTGLFLRVLLTRYLG